MTEVVDKGVTSNTFKNAPKPLPPLNGIVGRTFVPGRKREHTEIDQREQEWREAVEWLKRMIVTERKKEGLGWHPYAVETEEINELIDEAFGEEK